MKFSRVSALLFALVAAICAPATLRAQLYWDTNGTTTGSGSTAGGTWNSSSYWNTNSNGTGTPGMWVDGSAAVFSANNSATSGTITVSSTVTVSSITIQTLSSVTISGSGSIILSGTGGNVIADRTSAIRATLGGNVGLTKSGTANLTLSGANSYTGATTINTGTLNIADTAALPSSSPIVMNGGTLNLDASGNYTNSLTVSATGTTSTSLSTSTTSMTFSGTVSLSNTLQIQAAAGQTFTLSGVISGSGGITKVGGNSNTTSVVILTAANTYSGTTSVSAGLLRVAGSGTLGSTTSALSVGSGATLDLNGTSQTVGSLTGLGTIYNAGSGASTLTVGSANTNNTFVGTILDNPGTGGTMALVKTGTGLLAIGNSANAFSGGITVNSGTLNLKITTGTAQTSFKQITGTLAVSGGTLLTGVATTTYGGSITLSSGSISPMDTGVAGTLVLEANKSFTMSGGTLNLSLLSLSSFDQIVGSGTGTVSLTGGTILLDGVGVSFDYTSTYQIFSGFSSVSSSGVSFSGYDTTNYVASVSNTGLLSFAPPAPVPEPATWAALAGAAGLVSAIWTRQGKRRRPTEVALPPHKLHLRN